MIKRKEDLNNMRKIMSKEITTTTLKLGKIKVIDGSPLVEKLPDETLLGEPNERNIGKIIYKKYGAGVTIYHKEIKKLMYEMEVEEFIKHATLKEGEEKTVKESNEKTEVTASTIITRQRRG
jgi:hypothetical protein